LNGIIDRLSASIANGIVEGRAAMRVIEADDEPKLQ
jgi:hypothetical protein